MSTYQDVLKIEMAERITSDPDYSLRTMAKQVKVSPAMLSSIMNSKRNLSAKKALEIAKSLGFNKNKTEYFVTLVQYDTASAEVRSELLNKLLALKPRINGETLDADVFKLIADWYHPAILKMTNTTQTLSSPEEAAKYLGITEAEAAEAFERLLRLNLLQKNEQGQYVQSHKALETVSAVPNQALRKFHRQMLEKAAQSLETQTPQEKFIGSETFSFDEEGLKEASDIIEECFTKVVRLADIQKDKKHVYHLGIQMFRLNKEVL